MSSALVRPGTPLQIAGNEAPSTLIRNLDSSATLYVGTGTGVSQYSYDMVLEAGAAYSTPPGAVYVATTAAAGCAIVYSPAGSGLVTPAPSAVGIVGKPTVSIPDGVAINGGVSVTGNVGVSGNVGIAGSVAVAGDVNVLGTIKNQVQQGSATIIDGDFTMPSYYAEINHGTFDVSQYQSLLIAVTTNYGASSANGQVLIRLDWLDADNTFITQDSVLYNHGGGTRWIIPIKGRKVIIRQNGDRFVPANVAAHIRAMVSTVPRVEEYTAYSSSLYRNANNAYDDGSSAVDLYGKHVALQAHLQDSSGAYTNIVPASTFGKVRGSLYMGGYAYTNLRFYAWDRQFSDLVAQFESSTLNTTQQFELFAPKAPMVIQFSLQQGQNYGTLKMDMVYT